jgi:ubiquinone/menaquinone biosynthesis C-methylase UbiE
MSDEIFDDYAFARLYDHFNGWMAGDDFYLALAQETGGPVLDLGCGTGMLACRIAEEGLAVVGADPAAGMLRVARARLGGGKVSWVASDGQSLQLPERFALIYMTGHAFQALLTDAEAVGVLAAAARHLALGGRFAFDTRNPACREWESWTPALSAEIVETAEHGRVEEATAADFDTATGVCALTHRYRFLDKGTEQTGRSRIRFVEPAEVARLLAEAGLAPLAWYGDWNRRPFTPHSKEIIVVADRATG